MACDSYRYLRSVFLGPPWPEIYATDTDRKQTLDEAMDTYGLMVEAYEDADMTSWRSRECRRGARRFRFEDAVESGLYAMTLSPWLGGWLVTSIRTGLVLRLIA